LFDEEEEEEVQTFVTGTIAPEFLERYVSRRANKICNGL